MHDNTKNEESQFNIDEVAVAELTNPDKIVEKVRQITKEHEDNADYKNNYQFWEIIRRLAVVAPVIFMLVLGAIEAGKIDTSSEIFTGVDVELINNVNEYVWYEYSQGIKRTQVADSELQDILLHYTACIDDQQHIIYQNDANEMFSYDLQSGTQELIETGINERFYDCSPNGNWLLFIDSDSYEIVFYNRSTRQIQRLAEGLVRSWVSDDYAVLMHPSNQGDEQWDLFSFDFQTGEEELLYTASEQEVGDVFFFNPETRQLYISPFDDTYAYHAIRIDLSDGSRHEIAQGLFLNANSDMSRMLLFDESMQRYRIYHPNDGTIVDIPVAIMNPSPWNDFWKFVGTDQLFYRLRSGEQGIINLNDF